MTKLKEEYGNNSIKSLKGAERVRTRPASMLGSDGLDGSKHTIIELVGNATDEQMAGYGDKLVLALYEDYSLSIRDYGRGVPLGWNEEEENWNYFLIYEELYAGGKFEDNQKILRKIDEANEWKNFKITDFPYLVTIGLNGLGAASTQYTSEYFEVISYRDGVASRMLYEKGQHVLDELEIYETTEPNGTYIKWKPDDEVFTDTKIPSKWLDKLCRQLSYVAGFNVTFNNKGKLVEYKAKTLEEAMKDVVEDCVVASNFTHTVDKEGDICVCQADIVLGSGGRGCEFFQNKVEIRGSEGVHARAFNTALWLFFDGIGKEIGIKFRDSDYAGKFSIIAETLSNKMSVRGQTKDYLDNAYIFDCLQECIFDTLKTEYQKGTSWVTEIIGETITNAQNRIAVAEMSKNLREIEKTTKRHKVSDKFVSCETYEDGKVEETEYFIVEGDSAGGRVKTARNSLFQCFLAIRGKSLNVYKAPIEKLINNREIKDMIASLGCGVDLGIDGYESFDISKLKVGKIIFLADADIDGKHIKMLLFLIFYKLFPELLYQGKVYILDTPLYIINLKDNTTVYCMDEEELNQKREEIGQYNIHSIDRFKGLGETDEETLWKTTLDPERRRMHQLKLERNDTELCDILEVLFGKSTDRRKRAILGSMMEGFDDVIENVENLNHYVEGLDLNSDLEVMEVTV